MGRQDGRGEMGEFLGREGGRRGREGVFGDTHVGLGSIPLHQFYTSQSYTSKILAQDQGDPLRKQKLSSTKIHLF